MISEDIWAIVPGKFSLAFSLAPEFYRRVYKTNPLKNFKTFSDDNFVRNMVSNTVWKENFLKFKET